jgi:hypothetical protein
LWTNALNFKYYTYVIIYLAYFIFTTIVITFLTVFILTHPVIFPCGRKLENLEKTHNFQQSVDWLFSPTILLVKGACSVAYQPTNHPTMQLPNQVIKQHRIHTQYLHFSWLWACGSPWREHTNKPIKTTFDTVKDSLW